MPASAPSFRDPAGCCFLFQGRVLRFVAAEALAEFENFLTTRFAREFIAAGKLIAARKLEEKEMAALRETAELKPLFAVQNIGSVFEHERISFPSYPHEWPPEMLQAAGRLTLELAQAALAEGFGLKDATPSNILFRGSEPVFTDALSFERRNPADPLWLAEAQFNRTFLLPPLEPAARGNFHDAPQRAGAGGRLPFLRAAGKIPPANPSARFHSHLAVAQGQS